MDEARDKLEKAERAAPSGVGAFGAPAHMEAAARAAGHTRVGSGAGSVGFAAGESGAEAVHGSAGVAGEQKGINLPLRWAFDEHDPPSRGLIDECVHCGFCLPSCPTYLLWGEEMDSPRGRIHLMKLATEGRVEMTDTFVRHFDQCLGCMGCLTACPSGVEYNKLIESTRQQIERRHPRPVNDRLLRQLIFALFPHPERLRLLLPLMRVYQRSGLKKTVEKSGILSKVPARLAGLHAIMPSVTRKTLSAKVPEHTEAVGQRRARVGLLTGCVQRVFFPQVNAATVRVLAAEGCEVYAPAGQGCCGALALHSGREAEAKEYARKLIDTFENYDLDYVAVNAAGCGSSMKEYGYLLRDDPQYAERAARFSERVRDATELLAELGPLAPRRAMKVTIAYHDSCHLAHAQGIRQQPRSLLQSIPGIELVPIAEGDICCGSAGIYNLVEPEPARELGERKVRHIYETEAQIVASANPGCTLQISATAKRLGRPLKVLHPVEILDVALRQAKTK